MRTAAARNGQGFTAFIAEATDAAALAILKGEASSTAALPVPLDVGATMLERMADMAARQEALGDRKPASTLIIGGLADTAWKIEVEAVAVA